MTDNQYKTENSNFDDPLLHRGCQLSEEYAPGQKVLSCGRCKLNQFDWLKDYEGQNVEGNVCLAEVRFKNDRKDYFVYPEDLNLEVGELVAVEAAIGHDIGIVTLLGEIVERQMKRKHFRTPINEMKSIYRRARANDVEKWLSANKLEKDTLSRTRVIAENLGLEMKLNDVEYQGDKTKAIFYYTADGRVDFRELIKKLGGIPRQGRDATNWRAPGIGQVGRHRLMWPRALLRLLDFQFPIRYDWGGPCAATLPQPTKAGRPMWQTEMLPQLRIRSLCGSLEELLGPRHRPEIQKRRCHTPEKRRLQRHHVVFLYQRQRQYNGYSRRQGERNHRLEQERTDARMS